MHTEAGLDNNLRTVSSITCYLLFIIITFLFLCIQLFSIIHLLVIIRLELKDLSKYITTDDIWIGRTQFQLNFGEHQVNKPSQNGWQGLFLFENTVHFSNVIQAAKIWHTDVKTNKHNVCSMEVWNNYKIYLLTTTGRSISVKNTIAGQQQVIRTVMKNYKTKERDCRRNW